MDIMEAGGKVSMSHVTARQEVRGLLKTLNIPKINEVLNRNEEKEDAGEGDSEKMASEAAGETKEKIAPKPDVKKAAKAPILGSADAKTVKPAPAMESSQRAAAFA